MMSRSKGRRISGLTGILALASAGSAFAGTATWDFTSDPTTGANALKIGSFGTDAPAHQTSGGNPGGFLGITYPIGSSGKMAIFPNIDPGKVVTAFKFEADLRVGNSTGDRAADGFSVSFAREGDPVLAEENISNQGVYAGGIAEGGSTTGIAVSFDTWSGNTLPDGADIEGIIVRVDNKTVLRQSLPTRHGACEDATSLQTGPRDAAYWPDGDPQAPESWKTLCWQPFVIDLTEDAKLTVKWKGRAILDKFQTSYFPTASQLVLAGRTGGANEHTHFDNIKLTTIAASIACVPNAPGNIKVAEAGATRALISWDPAILPCDPTGRVAYEVSRDGTVIAPNVTDIFFDDRGVTPSKTYQYSVAAKNIAGQKGTASTVSATTVALVDSVGFVTAKVYEGIGGTPIDPLFDSERYPASPHRVLYLPGLTFGEPSFGNTLGDNFAIVMETVITPAVSGSYRFFIRSDDASRLFLNTSGAALPNPTLEAPIAEETGCCAGFQEPGDPRTSEPVNLTAGRQYGLVYIVKEGGGGDWGQVAWRIEGDTTAPGQLRPISGAVVSGKADPVGGKINITSQPASTSAPAHQAATFSVVAETSSPYSSTVVYQWFKNGAAIPGANGSTYMIPVVGAGDNGAKYKALVAVPGKSMESAEATLTVAAATPAKIVSVAGSDTFTSATIKFDQPVAAPSATTAGNYTVAGLTVSAAALVDQFTVRLTTSRQAEDTHYVVAAKGVNNLAGSPSDTTGSLHSWKFTAGKAKISFYTGIGGVDLPAMTGNANYPDSPNETRILDQYEGPTGYGDNYGARVETFITPKNNGDYVFFLSADDNAELYLSTDASPANAKLIAREPQWNGERQWTLLDRRNPDAPENRSDKFAETAWPTGAKITLTAGNRYYSYMLYKEGGGGDNGAVAWKLASAADPANGSPALTGDSIGYFAPAPPATASVSIARSATGLSITYTGTLQSADVVTGPYSDVAGATSPYSTSASAASRYFRSRQ